MQFQGHIQNLPGKIQENIMAHLSTLPMDPHLQAAHAARDFGREWAERAELKNLMERPFLFSSQRWQHGCIYLSEMSTSNGHMAGCPLKSV